MIKSADIRQNIYKRKNFLHIKKRMCPYFERIAFIALGKNGIEWITKGLVIITIFIAVYINNNTNYDALDSALLIGSPLSLIFLLFSSDKLPNKLNFRRVKGYWEYKIYPDQGKPLRAQQPESKRVVQIYEENSELKFRGWLCHEINRKLFESTEVIISPPKEKNGQLVYWYINTLDTPSGETIHGVVFLKWHNPVPWEKVNEMSGIYLGRITNDIGVIKYQRISKDEFIKTVKN